MRALSWLVAFSLFAPTGKVINFDTYTIGKLPPGWSVPGNGAGALPQWEIHKDRSAPTQPYVLAQLSATSLEDRAPLAILNDVTTRDADISVRIKPVSRTGKPARVVWFGDYRDENQLLFRTRQRRRRNTLGVFKVENGQRTPLLSGIKHPIPVNDWSILKVSARGARFQIFLDHRRLLQGQDGTFAGSGKVGLWAGAGSVTFFDDFRVYPK